MQSREDLHEEVELGSLHKDVEIFYKTVELQWLFIVIIWIFSPHYKWTTDTKTKFNE